MQVRLGAAGTSARNLLFDSVAEQLPG
jgi:hypothetical protein